MISTLISASERQTYEGLDAEQLFNFTAAMLTGQLKVAKPLRHLGAWCLRRLPDQGGKSLDISKLGVRLGGFMTQASASLPYSHTAIVEWEYQPSGYPMVIPNAAEKVVIGRVPNELAIGRAVVTLTQERPEITGYNADLHVVEFSDGDDAENDARRIGWQLSSMLAPTALKACGVIVSEMAEKLGYEDMFAHAVRMSTLHDQQTA